MALKSYRPTTPSRRGLVLSSHAGLWKGSPLKKLTKGKSSSGGRGGDGRIAMRRRGGGHKRLYRSVDFRRVRHGDKGKVERLEYDPNRTAFLALLKYEDGDWSYILAPEGLKAGDEVVSSKEGVDVKAGCAAPLKTFPPDTQLHNIEMKAGAGGCLARAAGTYAVLEALGGGYATLRLSSGERRLVREECMATVGVVSNADHFNRSLAKAGRNRWLGKRPKVRGVAMNPVDHPHGGGEGKSSGGRASVTPSGVSTKGKRTRRNKMTTKYILRDRRLRRSRR